VHAAIADGTLPCASKLSWLAKGVESAWIVSTINNQFNRNELKHLQGPFWARLYRCSDSDAQQLQHFFDHVAVKYIYDSNIVVDPKEFHSYNLGYAINVGASDLFHYGSASAKTFDQVLAANEFSLTVEGADVIISFARSVSLWPAPPQNPIGTSFMKPSCPVHILVGTLDANTPVGQVTLLLNHLSY
jgi:hypothetical protein